MSANTALDDIKARVEEQAASPWGANTSALHAAAPKLLAALERVVARHERGDFYNGPVCLACDAPFPCATVQIIQDALS